MIANVQWQYTLLDFAHAEPFRVKHRKNSPDVPQSGIDKPMSDVWQSAEAPAKLTYMGRTFIPAFWSVRALDTSGGATAHIEFGRRAYEYHEGGTWTVFATLYYIWDMTGQGEGEGGGRALLFDAFDVALGEFIGDDFVDVLPDGSMTHEANEQGYIDTDARIAAGAELTLAHRDTLPRRRFRDWVRFVSIPDASELGPQEGDVEAHHDDLVLALAFYDTIETAEETWRPPRRYPIYNPLWALETHGGLIAPGPQPWSRQAAAALELARAADGLAPELRAEGLRLAQRQLSIAAEGIGKQLDSEREK